MPRRDEISSLYIATDKELEELQGDDVKQMVTGAQRLLNEYPSSTVT